MLTSVVIFSRHPHLSTPFRHRDEKPVTASPLESALTNRDVRKSFRPLCLPASFARRIRLYENCRVCTNNSHSGTPRHPPATSILFVSFHALTNCPPQNPFLLTFMHRMGGVGVPLHCPRFVSQPYICLLNYLDPIFPGAGPAERFPHSTQRPRSRT